jgi:hypothetical protein
MATVKLDTSVCFKDNEEHHRFLFKAINFGKASDQLKFLFNRSRDHRAVIATGDGKKYPHDSLIRSYAELTYHADGSLLWKYPESKRDRFAIHSNPHGEGSRRTPLNKIGVWEPVFMGNIIRYRDCPLDSDQDSEILCDGGDIFNGEPFEFHVFLGDLRNQTPINAKHGELVHRLYHTTCKLDMIILVKKSSYQGDRFTLGNIVGWNDNNRIRISEPRLQVKDGAVQLDLSILMNTAWNGNVVDDKMKLSIQALKQLPPMTMFCKSYLRDNPYLSQIETLVGFNKGFAISVSYEGIDLSQRMTGILDKDEKGSFLGIGTNPHGTT